MTKKLSLATISQQHLPTMSAGMHRDTQYQPPRASPCGLLISRVHLLFAYEAVSSTNGKCVCFTLSTALICVQPLQPLKLSSTLMLLGGPDGTTGLGSTPRHAPWSHKPEGRGRSSTSSSICWQDRWRLLDLRPLACASRVHGDSFTAVDCQPASQSAHSLSVSHDAALQSCMSE